MKKFLVMAALSAAMWMGAQVNAQEAKKPTEVRVCPMAGKAVKGDGAGNSTFKDYKVFFCCGGCKGHFDGLSDEEKQKKVDAALKKQEEGKKKEG
jgi:hypothetical protein